MIHAMLVGVLALIVAIIAAGWLLFRLAGNKQNSSSRNMTALKVIAWLALSGALLAAKLWPLAFMVLLAAGGVAAIEALRGRDPELDEASQSPKVPARAMSEDEALSVLGLQEGANPEDIRQAHRKLISQLHPDRGGTDYLAAKINEARDFLLRRLGEK
ncbi:DnaJ domain-containing protein [Hyphococcus sp. DH-69]|uniref:DnaJ domain-containing protein n=1 Tax=Hyphococcus formosus TaxID=3143534 RepID=UPI00398B9047